MFKGFTTVEKVVSITCIICPLFFFILKLICCGLTFENIIDNLWAFLCFMLAIKEVSLKSDNIRLTDMVDYYEKKLFLKDKK